MDTKNLSMRVRQLEFDIHGTIQKLIHDFKKETNLEVKDIEIVIHDVSTVASNSPKRIVGVVNVEVEI